MKASQEDNSSCTLRRGHRRQSLLVLEGCKSPSWSTLLNESEGQFTSGPSEEEKFEEAQFFKNLSSTALTPTNTAHHNMETVPENFHHHHHLVEEVVTCTGYQEEPLVTSSSSTNLLHDISRCQDQVEELIQLFSLVSKHNETNADTGNSLTDTQLLGPPLLSRQTAVPRLPWKVESNIPRRNTSNEVLSRSCGRYPHQEYSSNNVNNPNKDAKLEKSKSLAKENSMVCHADDHGGRSAVKLENARADLEQSLENALRVLDEFTYPTNQGCCIYCSGGHQPYHDLLQSGLGEGQHDAIVQSSFNSYNHHGQYSELQNLASQNEVGASGVLRTSSPRQNYLLLGGDGKRDLLESKQDDRRHKFNVKTHYQNHSNPSCSLPLSGPEEHLCCHYNHNFSLPLEHEQFIDSCSTSLNCVDNNGPTMIPTYRVFFQDPILCGPICRLPSQSLSGMESLLPQRTLTTVERDAMSDCGDCMMDDMTDNKKTCRRTKSAISNLFPKRLCRVDPLPAKMGSIAGSSDWDMVEGGISVNHAQSIPHHVKKATIDKTIHNEEPLPGRLCPEEAPWTPASLSKAGSRRRDHRMQDGIYHRSVISEFSTREIVMDPVHPMKVDQSVQCDLFSGRSEKQFASAGGGCVSGLFRKKKQNAKKKTITEMMISASFLSQTMGHDSHSSLPMCRGNGVFCGIRTAVKAAFWPPRQSKHGR